MREKITTSRAGLTVLHQKVLRCDRCPELRAYCAEVGRTKRRAYEAWDYHAKPVPGFGDPGARIWIIGLAPAAHGANRTGRMFTGDRSGDFLYAGLHRAGLASQAQATSADDGLVLSDVYISAALRCAPPGNKPTPQQLDNCKPHLQHEWRSLKNVNVMFALGGIAWNAALGLLGANGVSLPSPKPKFSHAGVVRFSDRALIGCYHVSQQNTFTGRLTEAMFDRVIRRAIELANG